MAPVVIAAESSALTDDDVRKRGLVKKLMQSQNKVLIDFAKHLVTVSFSAVGVVLALKDKWVGASSVVGASWLLGIAIAMFLASGVTATIAVGVFIHRVNLVDYADAELELQRVATLRYRLTRLSLGLSLIATILVATVALRA
jgi:hypothetical protein